MRETETQGSPVSRFPFPVSKFQKFQNLRDHEEIMRVNVSNIAKLSGFHPYCDLPMSVIDLVYQDREDMRKLDSKKWNIQWIDEDALAKSLLQRKGAENIKKVYESKGMEQNLTQVRQTEKRMNSFIQKTKNVFSNQEKEFLVSKAKHKSFTTFGTKFESKALEAYEKKTGREVRSSNTTKYFWAFPKDINKLRAPNLLHRNNEKNAKKGWTKEMMSSEEKKKNEDAIVSAVLRFADLKNTGSIEHDDTTIYDTCVRGEDWIRFPSSLTKRERFLVHRAAERVGLAHASEGEDGSKTRFVTLRRNESIEISEQHLDIALCMKRILDDTCVCNNDDHGEEKEKDDDEDVVIVLTGMVDGIAEDIYYEDENEEDEEETENIDELDLSRDNMRVRNIVVEVKHRMMKSPSTLPPLYDQIQCVAYCLMLGTECCDLVQCARHGNNNADQDIGVTRVELNDTYQHRKHFFQVIAPRLYKVSSFVQELRKNEKLRQSFVSSEDLEKWKMLEKHLGFLNLSEHQKYQNAKRLYDRNVVDWEMQMAIQRSLGGGGGSGGGKRHRKRRKKENRRGKEIIDLTAFVVNTRSSMNRTRSGRAYSPMKI